MVQLVDKGRVVAEVGSYPEKINGQPQFNQDGSAKMKTKWMTIGECTKWQGDDGSIYETEDIYLRPVSVNGDSFKQRRFWDSEQQNNQQQGYQNNQQQQYSQPQQQQQYNNQRG